MKNIVVLILTLLVFISCSTYKELDKIDVCPALIQAVKSGWKKKGNKRNTNYCCNNKFSKRFSDAMKMDSCHQSLTKEDFLMLLGTPDEIREGADSFFKLMDLFEEDKEYETLSYKCQTEDRINRAKKKFFFRTRTYYFLFEKPTNRFVAYFNTK